MLLLYRPKSDTAAFSGGSWQTGLPLTNLADPRLWRVARSVDADPANTKFMVSLTQEESFLALVLGPMNVTTAYEYRIRAYTDGTFSSIIAGSDTDWVNPFGGTAGDALSLEWENQWFWLGIEPFDDEERGIFLIHIYPELVTSSHWSFEIKDENNPDGYIEAGRLFMPSSLTPSINYSPDGNGLGFLDKSLRTDLLGGGEEVDRRLNPRVFRFAIPILPDDEVYREVYKYLRAAGFDGEVFVIPNPDDPADIMQNRAFLGRMTQMDPITQLAANYAGFGAEIKEIT